MGSRIGAYKDLIRQFLDDEIDPVDFKRQYLNKFKNEKKWFAEKHFHVLDRLFGDIDDFVADKRLLKEFQETVPRDYYLDLPQMKDRAREALKRL